MKRHINDPIIDDDELNMFYTDDELQGELIWSLCQSCNDEFEVFETDPICPLCGSETTTYY